MAMNRLPASFAPTSRWTRSKKYCLKMFGSSVEPDLLETMTRVFLRSTLFSNARDLRRVRRIEHVQLGEAVDLSERQLQHFGTEARAPHTEQQDVSEAGTPGRVGHVGQPPEMRQLAIRDAEPSEPLVLALATPNRCVAPPEASDLALCLPFRQRGLYRGGKRLGKGVRQAVDSSSSRLPGLRVHRGQQLVEGIREELNPFGEKLCRSRPIWRFRRLRPPPSCRARTRHLPRGSRAAARGCETRRTLREESC